MIRRTRGCLCVLLLSMSWVVWAETTTTATVLDRSPVRFATSTVKPWGMVNEGVPEGLLIELLQGLEAETGINATNVMLPYPRVIHALYGGEVDMAVLFDSPSALSTAIRVGHVVDTRVLVIGRAGAAPLTDVQALQGRLVGYIRGSRYGPSFDEARHFRKLPVNTMMQGLAMLVRNRLDAMTGTDQSFFWALKEMQLAPERLSLLTVVSGATGSLYMSKISPRQALIPVYREALLRLKARGVIGQIFSETHDWRAPAGWEAAPPDTADAESKEVFNGGAASRP